MIVVGLDASLVRSGVATPAGTTTWRPRKLRGPERLDWILGELLGVLDEHEPDVAALEGYAFGARGRAIYNVGELGGILRWALYLRGVPTMEVPPAVLKKFATGRGNATKEQVVESLGHLGVQVDTHDEADAWWLRAIAHQVVDDPILPPRLQDDLADKVSWTHGQSPV